MQPSGAVSRFSGTLLDFFDSFSVRLLQEQGPQNATREDPDSSPGEGSGQIRAKIYAKLEPFPVQSGTRELREVFHTVLRDTMRVTDPARVQSVLSIEDHVVPASV